LDDRAIAQFSASCNDYRSKLLVHAGDIREVAIKNPPIPWFTSHWRWAVDRPQWSVVRGDPARASMVRQGSDNSAALP